MGILGLTLHKLLKLQFSFLLRDHIVTANNLFLLSLYLFTLFSPLIIVFLESHACFIKYFLRAIPGFYLVLYLIQQETCLYSLLAEEVLLGICLWSYFIIVTTRFFMFLDIITFIFTVFIFNNLVFILTKSHLGSYPCPLNINFYWNMGFTLGIVIVVQIVTGLFISFHYSSDINEAHYSVFFLIREIYYGWSLRFPHSSGASFVFLFVFLHIGRSLFYGSFFYNPNTWFSGILILLLLMGIAFLGYVLPFGQMSFWGATVITNLLSPFPCLIEWVCGGYCVNSPTLKRFFIFHFVFPHLRLEHLYYIYIFFIFIVLIILQGQ